MNMHVLLTNRLNYRLYWADTHDSCVKVAKDLGIYYSYMPDANGTTKAQDMIPGLTVAVETLKNNPKIEDFRDFAWWTEEYLAACQKYPEAKVTVCLG